MKINRRIDRGNGGGGGTCSTRPHFMKHHVKSPLQLTESALLLARAPPEDESSSYTSKVLGKALCS